MSSKTKTQEAKQARCVTRNIRTSPRKLNLVAGMIRGHKADRALAILKFSKRRIANTVLKSLESAIANAENNHAMDIDRLYVKEAHVGQSFVMKRFRPRARGRVGKILKPFSHLTLIVEEQESATPKKASKGTKETKAKAAPKTKKAAKTKTEEAA